VINQVIKIDKLKRPASVLMGNNVKLEVNFFLSPTAETHSGSELIVDVLNSGQTILPMEDCYTGEIILVNRMQIKTVELSEGELSKETIGFHEDPVTIELMDGDPLKGSLFIDMPPGRSRLSDYLNSTSQFIYIFLNPNDFIVNKSFIATVRPD
jgi:hypothetical protein